MAPPQTPLGEQSLALPRLSIYRPISKAGEVEGWKMPGRWGRRKRKMRRKGREGDPRAGSRPMSEILKIQIP